MYNFIDVNETSEGTFLPSEALKINGKYIENLIPGYRTLSVAGREALAPEVYTFETGTRDGSGLSSKRYPARTITVTYQIIADSNEAFRDAYNAFGGILDVIDAQLIFNDEPDKFYTGTPSYIGEVEPGRNAVVGQFEILCLDPFKYSVEEYEATPAANGAGFAINYKGTYKSFPKMQVNFAEESEPDPLTGKGECGYVAFFDANENIIQVGDPDEVDGDANAYPKSQALINQELKLSTAWSASASKLWTLNKGTFEWQQIGTLGMKQLPNKVDYYLSPTAYGSYSGGWHGASMSRTIPADASGNTTNSVFDFYFKPVFAIASGTAGKNSLGELSLILTASTGEKVAKIRIAKNAAGKTANLMFYVMEKCIYSKAIDVSAGNKQFGSGRGNPNCRISKTPGGFVFVMGGVTKTFHVDSSVTIPNITKFEFMYSQYGTTTPVEYNGLLWVRFVKNYCETYKDIPNKFQSNDDLEIDCRTGTIRLNNTPAPELGALGNDWEQFHLSPGLNQIGYSYSNWVAEVPEAKIIYREVFL